MESIAVLGLGDHRSPRRDILKLLSVLLTTEMKPDEKKEILERDFAIPMTVEMKKEADTMCTYGQALLKEGEERGSEKKQRQLLLNMLKNGMPAEQASAWTNVPVEYVRKLAEELKNEASGQPPAASRDLRPAIGETSFFFPPCPSQQKETEMVRMSDTKVPEGKFGADGDQQPAVSSGLRHVFSR